MLEQRSSADAALLLRSIKGIGPWTAAVILLRGLGRLDTFPGNDSGVAANLALIAGEPAEAGPIAEALGHSAACCTSICCWHGWKRAARSAVRPT